MNERFAAGNRVAGAVEGCHGALGKVGHARYSNAMPSKIVLVLAVAALTGPLAAQPARPVAAPDSGWWSYRPGSRTVRGPEYTGVTRRSVYLPMRDGVRLAVDYYLPANLPTGVTLPTILEQTRYQRSFRWAADSLDRISTSISYYVTRGYAYLVADVRGSGASFGRRVAEFDRAETEDGKDLVDWIVAQPWSNGRVGAQGGSYVGSTAEQLLVNRHSAVKAVAPQFSMFDTFADIVAPGGLELTFFVKDWGTLVHEMDQQTVPPTRAAPGSLGVRPVDEDRDGSLLAAAIRDHRDNYRVDELLGTMTARDVVGSNARPIDSMSTHRFWRIFNATKVPILGVSGWWDGGYPYSSIKRFLNVRTPGSRMVLGPWSHGGRTFLTPRDTVSRATSFDHRSEVLRFFDRYLKGIDNGIDREPPIRYYTMGEERWKSATTWPIPGTRSRTWFFGEGGVLGPVRGTSGVDRYQVDTTAGTGNRARWNTLVAAPGAQYPDRAAAARKLLVYDSPPLERDLEVTGHPSATLWLSSTAADGAIFVYLEERFPDGHVGYVTEGVLRARHRALKPAAAPYRQPTPYRTLAEADAKPLVPGAVDSVWVDLLPVSHLFKAGSRIRVAVAGADRDHFSLVPAGQTPVLSVHRGARRASRVELPIAPRGRGN